MLPGPVVIFRSPQEFICDICFVYTICGMVLSV